MDELDLLIFFAGIVGLAIFYFLLVTKDRRDLKKLIKNYSPDKDLSRSGKEAQGRVSFYKR